MNSNNAYILPDGMKKEILIELVKKYQEQLLNVSMIDIGSINGENEVEIDLSLHIEMRYRSI